MIAIKNYVPTLAIRAGEMTGLEHLPSASKDRMTPCFLLAPWVNSSELGKAIERLEKAFPKRGYFLDIDRNYHPRDADGDPQKELKRLQDPAHAFRNWVRFVEMHPNVWPCIQFSSQNTKQDLVNQIHAIQTLDRPYCMRIPKDHPPSNMDEILAAFSETGTADFAIVLEGGWVSNPLILTNWFKGKVQGIAKGIDADVCTVLSCTSIPQSYAKLEPGLSEIPFSNRKLVSQLSKEFNRPRFIYGDWGSTRPRDNRRGGPAPARIDYPKENSWVIARDANKPWDFKQAAAALVKKKGMWAGHLGIWGEEMILGTTINQEIGIHSAHKNIASRVNIHLHLQSFYGNDYAQLNLDEKWVD